MKGQWQGDRAGASVQDLPDWCILLPRNPDLDGQKPLVLRQVVPARLNSPADFKESSKKNNG